MNSVKVALFLFLAALTVGATESPFKCPNFTGKWEGWCHRESLFGSGAYLETIQISQKDCESIQLNTGEEFLPIGPLLVASHTQEIGECKVDIDTAVQLKFDATEALNLAIVHQLKTANCPNKPPRPLNKNLPNKRSYKLAEAERLLVIEEEGSGVDPDDLSKFTFSRKCYLDKK